MTLTWQSLSKLGEDYRRKGKVKERQEEWLFSCLERNKITSYGQLFGFEDIRSVEDYREKVPLISYEHISPWVELQAAKATSYSRDCQLLLNAREEVLAAASWFLIPMKA